MSKPELKYSEAWCVCLAGLLEDGHDKWPLLFERNGEPMHWCPTCYDESIVTQREEAEEDDEPFDADSERVAEYATDAATIPDWQVGDACPNGHAPPIKEEA